MNKPDGSSFTNRGDSTAGARPFALFCGLGIHNNSHAREKAEVAHETPTSRPSEVLSYHAHVAESWTTLIRLSKCLVPSARVLEAHDFAFTDIGHTFAEWLLSVKTQLSQVSLTITGAMHLNVTQTMHAMLKSSTELRALNRLDKMALLIACLCHDLDHRGTRQQISEELTLSPLAQLYSSSMLERHHFNPLRHLVPRTRDILYGLLMTAADLSAITKPWNVQYKTAHLVANEFYEQGDRERSELNMQPEDLKDRDKRMRLPAMQVGFIDFVCQPVLHDALRVVHRFGEPQRWLPNQYRKQWDSLIDRSSAEGVRDEK
uniref:PDEase domain-containing protein n=1 Tax=Macrostomum lignano TaxID=282301 RepID=A0A1I8F966_9PLAT